MVDYESVHGTFSFGISIRANLQLVALIPPPPAFALFRGGTGGIISLWLCGVRPRSPLPGEESFA